MTEEEYSIRYDFLCEKRLRDTDKHLHKLFRDSVLSMDMLLANYKAIFPFYTDHTFQHSEQVIRYCNIIAGEEIISSLNPDEIYILLMGAALHDIGMGISEKDFNDMYSNVPELISYMDEHPDYTLSKYTRAFHQELGAQFIKKYSRLFDIPSEEYIYCISQVIRGHRKADILNSENFPADFRLKNGNTVNIAFLTALVKLADELDVTADRNLLFDYNTVAKEWSEKQTMCYKCHGAIKNLGVRKTSLVLYYQSDEPSVCDEILNTRGKVERTFKEYCNVVKTRTDFGNRILSVEFENIK